MLFKYKAVSGMGQIVEGFYEGESKDDVLEMLREYDHQVISIEESSRGKLRELIPRRVTNKDISIFCRQFYTMLKAGITIVRSLDILKDQLDNRALQRAVGVIYEDVQKGLSLSESMAKHDDVFPMLLVSMVEAGEVSGNLDTMMERMAEYYEKENKIENKIRSALTYPIILSIVTIAVVIFLLTGVVPTFVEIFEDSGVPLPGLTTLLLSISTGLIEHWYTYISLVMLIVILISVGKNTDRGRRLFDWLKIKTPGIRDTNIKILASRFTRTLSTLLSSGIPLIQSFDVVSKVVGNEVLIERLELAKQDVIDGVSLSETIKKIDIFPPMLDSMISVGEESGVLDDTLQKTADFYDEEVEVAIERLTTMLEPALIIIMGFVVGFIVLSIALPMFEMVNVF